MKKILLVYKKSQIKSVKNIYQILDKNYYQIDYIEYSDGLYYTKKYMNIDNIDDLITKQNIIFNLTNEEEVSNLLEKLDTIYLSKSKVEGINEVIDKLNLEKIEYSVYSNKDDDVVNKIRLEYDFPLNLKKSYRSEYINNVIELENCLKEEKEIKLSKINPYKQVVIGIIGNQYKQLVSQIAYIDSNEDKIVIPYNTSKEIENNIYEISKEIYKELKLDNHCIISYYIDSNKIYYDTINTDIDFSKNNLLNTLFNYSNITNKELLDILINLGIDNYTRRKYEDK